MKKFLFVPALLLSLGATAQDIYKVEQFSGEDLNGTARFVGMGGAMNALGADISTIHSNPAGIGLFRRSDASVTGSLTTQSNALSFYDIGKSRVSFDQAGFVYANRTNGTSLKFINFGFNYKKRRNFKNFFGIDNAETQLSQSDQLEEMTYHNGKPLDLSVMDNQKKVSPLAVLGHNSQMVEYNNDTLNSTGADYYNYKRVHWGGISQYDFNISANWLDQIYAGITFGIQDVNFNSGLAYGEHSIENGVPAHQYYFNSEDRITGSGFDIKLGLILRPIETSPFRIGFSVTTPTWYDLSYAGYARMDSPYASTDANGNKRDNTVASTNVSLDYKIRTPWKFNLSLGTTVGKNIAIDAEYEYADYKGSNISYPDYDSYNYWSDSYSTYSDEVLKKEIKQRLNSVSTFRIGLEARLAQNLFGRLGYNYVTKAIKEDAYLNLFVNKDAYYSPSYYYQSHTDYANLGDINRFTVGLGYRLKHFYVDAAFQYQAQKADVYAFYVYDFQNPNSDTNLLAKQKLNLNRSNFMITLGYKF